MTSDGRERGLLTHIAEDALEFSDPIHSEGPTAADLHGLSFVDVDRDGELDLVTRVSRVHTIWFDSGSAAPAYVPPVLAPTADAQPAGTTARLDYRGATQVPNPSLLTDATKIDPYGDRGLGVGGADPVFLNGDPSWRTPITALNGARFFQVRATLVANAATLQRPSIDTLGFAWRL